MNFDINNISVAQWFHGRDKHRCGYCKNASGSISDGMWAETLTVEDYQDLIDRGWRRSGKYCYKPVMDETCCPQYTIKCDAINFSLTKSQKKVIKKFNKFLEDGVLNKKDVPPEAHYGDGCDSSSIFVKDIPNININAVNYKILGTDFEQVKNDLAMGEPHQSVIGDSARQQTSNVLDSCGKHCDIKKQSGLKTTFKEGVGVDLTKPPSKKAKLLRIERKQEKLLNKGESFQKKQPVQTQKSLKDFLEDFTDNSKHKLKLKLIATSVPGKKWDQIKEVEFELYKKYQMIVHNDPPEKLSMKSFHRFLVNSPLTITLERMSGSHELFELSASLFKKYQIFIHNEPPDECDEEQFYNFLVQTPLQPVKFPNGAVGPGFGSFHQQYWIDDKLVAVGVIDILPKCVSSVYFFYDPDYRDLTLGTYGILREVHLTRSLHENVPSISNYYMGFYIHSCPKMRYKGKLVPSYLLCPETYVWVPIEKCVEKLEASKYSRLNEDIDAIDENLPQQRDIGDIKICYHNKLMSFREYKRFCSEQDLYDHIGQLIGRKCVKRILFWV